MAKVIGIDFGNWQTFVCFVNGMDEATKTGGVIEDLIPSRYREIGSEGIPNEFFWNLSEKNGTQTDDEQYGFAAARETNRPPENHLRLLKQHLGEKVTLRSANGKHTKTYLYDDIITKMFEYHVGLANDALRENHGESATTNLISITYPARLRDPGLLRYYIDLAEKADSGALDEDGNMQKIKVVGTVCEPSAAGLDRLNECRDTTTTDHVTYGVFDLGGGTFDLSIVTLYPNGKTYPGGRTYYYDLVCEGRGLNIAGSVFTDRLRELLISKTADEFGEQPNAFKLRQIARDVERCKKELSESDMTTVFIEDGDFDSAEITVTRGEFEQAIAGDVDQIMSFTRSFFEEHSAHKPDEIIMTGGSSYIPYIKERLSKTLPAYRDRIFLHRPSKAAAYGAARFYTMYTDAETFTLTASTEDTDDTQSVPLPSPVRRTVEFDLGTPFGSINNLKIHPLIKAGTEIPCSSEETEFYTMTKTTETSYDIFRAVKQNPDPSAVMTDYHVICKASLKYGRSVPKDTETNCRLMINELGIATLKAWERDNTSIRIETTFPIDNSTDDSVR